MHKKIPVSYRVSDQYLANIAEVKEKSGSSATAIVENAVADFSIRWRLLDDLFGDLKSVRLYLDARRIMESMMLGFKSASEWDEPIEHWLSRIMEIYLLENRQRRDQAISELSEMLARLSGKVDALRVRIESGNDH